MKFVAVLNFSYGTSRFKSGQKVADIPLEEIKNLINQGIVREVFERKPREEVVD